MAAAVARSRSPGVPLSGVGYVPSVDTAWARLSPQQLADVLALWSELYWFPPRSLEELTGELAR